MDAVVLSRLQFAFTMGYHILWPTFTIGIASYVMCLSGLWWWTRRPVYRDLMRFWARIFGMGFAMGVITGLVLSYEIGTNWSGFSKAVSNVLGPLFMYEALTAFFLEAGFIGVVLFGEKRVGPGAHFFACCMVAFGTLLSATWITAANSWMQTPAGAIQDANGIFHAVSWPDIVFSPSFPYRVSHMVCASFLTGAFVVAGVSALHLLWRRHLETARKGFSMAMWTVLLLAPLQILLGDMQGLNTREHQPTKLAAMEGLWDSGHGVAATLFAWPDMATESNRFELSIPRLGSLYLTHSWNGEVQGLKAVPAEDRPNVPIVFFAFRIMVGIGLILLAVAITGAVLRFRGRLYSARWFHFAAVGAMPLGFVAVLAGWTVTEAGRQPFIVYGILRTAQAAAPVSTDAISVSLGLFVIVYNLLLLAFLWFGARQVWRGPPVERGEPQTLTPARPGGRSVAPPHALAADPVLARTSLTATQEGSWMPR